MSSLHPESSIMLPPIREMFPEHLPKPRSTYNTSWSHSKTGSTLPNLGYVGPGSPSMSSAARRHTTASGSWHQHPSQSHAFAPPMKIASPIYPSPPPFNRTHSDTLTFHQQRPHPTSPNFSFDVLRSDPSSSSLQHIASSASFQSRSTGAGCNLQGQGEVANGSAPVFKVSAQEHMEARGVGHAHTHRSTPSNVPQSSEPECGHTISTGPGYSTIISFPISGPLLGSGRDRSPDDPEVASDSDMPGSSNGKKHVCTICLKRFNRPSSLRIHANTHTGATPFRCPWPDCAREFNVNSNMRRHYRNHTAPGAPRPQTNDPRRRRKRGSPPALVFVGNSSRAKASKKSDSPANPPISSLSISEDEDDMSDSNATGNFHEDDEEDELESPIDESSSVERSMSPRSNIVPDDPQNPFSRYSQSHLRSSTSMMSNHSVPSSSAPSVQDHIYSPSSAYSQSIANPKVSTALRPAFHSMAPFNKHD